MNMNIIQQCRVCNSNNISFDKEIPSFLSKKDIRRFFVCNDCGTIMDSADTAPDMAITDTNVEEINILELPASYIKHYIEVGAGLFSFASQLQLLTTLFPENHNTIKYLDIGCGFGFSVHMAQQFGWESIGVEPSQIGKVGSEILEFNLVSDYLEKSSIPQYNFNFVAASEAIEHVQDPDVFIQKIAKYLSPKGVLFLTTPNAESIILGSEIEEEWLEGYNPGSHFNLLSADAIRLILSRNGFEYVKIILSEGSSGQKRMTVLASKDDVLPESIDWNDININTHIFLKKYLQEVISERETRKNKDTVYNSTLCRLFEILVNEGEYEEAKKYIIEIDEIIAGLGFNLAIFDISKKKGGNFEQHANQVPGYLAHYLYYKGMIYLNHDQNYHEANNHFKMSADVSQLNEEIASFYYPGKWYGRAKYHQGLALLYDGKQEGAIKIFDALLSEPEKLPADVVEHLYWNKGVAHLQIKKNHQALHYFKKFLVNKYPESAQPALQVIKVLHQLIEDLQTQVNNLQTQVKNSRKFKK